MIVSQNGRSIASRALNECEPQQLMASRQWHVQTIEAKAYSKSRFRRRTMGKLERKVAVITGATSGMALATAKLFVEEGAYVFITGRRQEQLDQAVKDIGKNVTGVQGDVSHMADLARLYTPVHHRQGREGTYRYSVRQRRLWRI